MSEKNYFKILKIFNNENDSTIKIKVKNITDVSYIIKYEDIDIFINSGDVIDFCVSNLEFTLKILIDDKLENFDINLSKKNVSGYSENTLVETSDGPIEIKNIVAGDNILDSNGNNLKIKNVYVFEINNKCGNKPILIKKSKCGINLPYTNIVMTIKNVLKIKKIILKGRSLYLNGKATLYTFKNTMKIYGIETENSNDFLLSGFIVESL